MIWAARNAIIADFIGNVFLLSVISYAAGIIGHYIGTYLNQSKFYRLMKRNFFGKYEKYINDFGGFIVIVAALTPRAIFRNRDAYGIRRLSVQEIFDVCTFPISEVRLLFVHYLGSQCTLAFNRLLLTRYFDQNHYSCNDQWDTQYLTHIQDQTFLPRLLHFLKKFINEPQRPQDNEKNPEDEPLR